MNMIIPLIVIITVIFTLFSLYQPFFLVKIVQKTTNNLIFYVETKENAFSITFDDGPNSSYTEKILDILDKHDAKATFFVIGNKVVANQQLLNEIKKRGHDIGNHSYDNRPTLFLTKSEFTKSLLKTERLINISDNIKFFRPASGWFRPALIKIALKHNYRIILGSAYVSDPRNPSKCYMLKALSSMLRPGIILVLHDGGKNRDKIVDILPKLLDNAQSKKLKSIPLSKLLKKS